jgi:hypothetical protein
VVVGLTYLVCFFIGPVYGYPPWEEGWRQGWGLWFGILFVLISMVSLRDSSSWQPKRSGKVFVALRRVAIYAIWVLLGISIVNSWLQLIPLSDWLPFIFAVLLVPLVWIKSFLDSQPRPTPVVESPFAV